MSDSKAWDPEEWVRPDAVSYGPFEKEKRIEEIEKTFRDFRKDMVNHPSHYKIRIDGVLIEALDIIREVLTREEFIGFLKGNCIKYQLRAKNKNGDEDWKKSAFYNKVLDAVLRDQEFLTVEDLINGNNKLFKRQVE